MSETVSETCIDCSRVMESACDCKETKKTLYDFSHVNSVTLIYSQIITHLYL